MTVDVNVRYADAAFLEDIDEIIEDTMVQMFILQPRDPAALEAAKMQANEHTALFYSAPLTLSDKTDDNCVGFFVDDIGALASAAGKPLFVDESQLDATMTRVLSEGGYRGIVLNALRVHDELENFYLAIGPGNVKAFDAEKLAKLPMQKLVLQSSYPDFGFGEIFETSKAISDVMFRPDPSIIAAATKSALTLLGFKK
ncbi:hypothetical protein [Sulfurimonas sp. HSL3-7]|uniref:hypothetical protein n=1 Tax=Sulfonitrofixus jiaomeiensis TaxID=3131938 RepID=UPI0031F83861